MRESRGYIEKEKKGTGKGGRGEEEIFRSSKKIVGHWMWRRGWKGG